MKEDLNINLMTKLKILYTVVQGFHNESENRYSSLTRIFPDKADSLFEQAEKNAGERYETYKNLAKI